MRNSKGAAAAGAYASIAALALAGCVSFSVKSWGAASVEDLQAENAYIGVYMQQMTRLAADLKAFAPTSTSPGPCNIGGSKQGCYDADALIIGDLNTMQAALAGAKVPPRFVDADRGLRGAISINIKGLGLRNQAIATSSDVLWREGAQALEDAGAAWAAAYAAFPADNKPPLSP